MISSEATDDIFKDESPRDPIVSPSEILAAGVICEEEQLAHSVIEQITDSILSAGKTEDEDSCNDENEAINGKKENNVKEPPARSPLPSKTVESNLIGEESSTTSTPTKVQPANSSCANFQQQQPPIEEKKVLEVSATLDSMQNTQTISEHSLNLTATNHSLQSHSESFDPISQDIHQIMSMKNRAPSDIQKEKCEKSFPQSLSSNNPTNDKQKKRKHKKLKRSNNRKSKEKKKSKNKKSSCRNKNVSVSSDESVSLSESSDSDDSTSADQSSDRTDFFGDTIGYSRGYSRWDKDQMDSLQRLRTPPSLIFSSVKNEEDKDSWEFLNIDTCLAALELITPNNAENSSNKTTRLRKKWESVFACSTVNHGFEIPRQQEATSSTPEVMQFKSNQKLLNPNSTPTSSRTPVPSKRMRTNDGDTVTLNSSSAKVSPIIKVTPLAPRSKPRYVAPTLPKQMTPQEAENFQYDEPELQEWQRNYQPQEQSPVFQKNSVFIPHIETIEEEVVRLRNENEALNEENKALRQENKQLKLELRKNVQKVSSQKYRDSKKMDSEPNKFEEMHQSSKYRIYGEVWEYLKKKYGDGAADIVDYLCKREIKREKTSLTPIQTLKLLKSCGITIDALRKIRSVLKEYEIDNPFASDRAVNLEREKLYNTVKLVKETVEMEGKNGEKVPTDVFTIESVKNEIISRITNLTTSGNYKPFFFNGVEELPCVISGDKGKDLTNLVMGVGSTQSPVNSPYNCSLLGYYKGNDSQANLYAAFSRLAEQVDVLKEIEIEVDGILKKFKIRWFVLGDFKFLNAIAGLNSNSCSFPCWGCKQKSETTYECLNLNEKSPERTMGIDLAVSQIRLPLFQSISFDHYIPPILHITLGPGAQLFEEICVRARELDATELQGQQIPNLLPSDKVRKSWDTVQSNIEKLKCELEDLNHSKCLYSIEAVDERRICDSMECYALHSVIEINNIFTNENFCTTCLGYFHKCCLYKGECPNCYQTFPTKKQSKDIIDKPRKELEKKIRQTTKAIKDEEEKLDGIISKFKIGKLASNVEKVFEKYGGSRKAFFQEFTGKQLVKMGRNIHGIFFALDPELQKDSHILKIVRAIIQFFNIKKLLTTKILNDYETNDIEETITEFANYMKLNLPYVRVKQKGHVFFKHLPEYVRKFGVAAFFTDEAIESFHVVINRYYRRIGNRKVEKLAELLFKYNKEDTWLHDCPNNC